MEHSKLRGLQCKGTWFRYANKSLDNQRHDPCKHDSGHPEGVRKPGILGVSDLLIVTYYVSLYIVKVGSMVVSGKLPTYPFPYLTLTLTSFFGRNVGFGKGWLGSFAETTIDSERLHTRQVAK